MDKKLFIVPFVIAAVFCFVLAGCYIEFDPGDVEKAPPHGSGTFNGKKDGTANGYRGPVKVELTLADGEITAVSVTHKEDGPGLALIENAKPLIIQANSFDPVVDIMSGATFAGNALIKAGTEAIGKVP